jgi:hypothetical protein
MPELARDSFGAPAGGSVLDITLHLAASIHKQAGRRRVRGTESLFGHDRRRPTQAGKRVR